MNRPWRRQFLIAAGVLVAAPLRGLEAGGLFGYGVNFLALYRRAPVFVDKILKGARPADIPVERPTMFEFVINMKTARALGLTFPTSIRSRADREIE